MFIRITKWSKLTPTSPGWFNFQDLNAVFIRMLPIPAQYFNEEIIGAYLHEFQLRYRASANLPGATYCSVYDSIEGDMWTVMATDTAEAFSAFTAFNTPEFLTARENLLTLFNVNMQDFDLVHSDIFPYTLEAIKASVA
jgi:hypothetical protein